MSSSERSKPLRAPMRLFLLTCLALGAAACQTVTPIPRAEIPESLKAKCERPSGKDDVKTVGDLASYSIRQDAELQKCEAKREGLVSILEAVNPPAKRKWWEF